MSFEFFEMLKDAGVPEAQAKAQVEVLQSVVNQYDADSRKELATKGDLADAKHEILKWMITALIAQSALIIAIVGAAIGAVIAFVK